MNKLKTSALLWLIVLILNLSSCETILDSLDSDVKVRFKNNTSETWSGARLRDGAEFTGNFGPSVTTSYISMEGSGTYTLEVLSGTTWLTIQTGMNVIESNEYTISIEGSSSFYSATIKKD